MKNEMNIKWNRFDREDPNTFPKDEDKQYLVTYRKRGTSEMDIALLPWSVADQWRLWEFDGCKILFWSEFNVQPCTGMDQQEKPETESSDIEYRTVTLRELSRHPYELDVDALIAVKNTLKKKLEWLESSYQEDNYIDSGAKSSFLFHCAVIETRFEKAPEIVPHDDLCYMYNDMIKRFMRIHPFFKECTNSIEITIEW